MADYAIHEETLVDVSNVIRKKDGTSALIDPADYAERINLMGMLEEKTVSGAIVTFSDGADEVPLKKCEVTLPASLDGYSEVDVVHTGKNLLNDSIRGKNGANIFFAHNTGSQIDFALRLKKGTYTFSVVTADGTTTNLYVKNSDTNTNITGFPAYNSLSKTFTLSEDTNCAVYVYKSGYTDVTDILTAQIEVGSTATAYEPYIEPTTHTASLGRTIYGGTADVVNGQGTDEDRLYTVDNTASIARQYGFQNAFYYFNIVLPADADTAEILLDKISNIFDPLVFGGASGIYRGNTGACQRSGYITFYHPDLAQATIDEAKAWLISHDAVFIYKLATPETFTFDPVPIDSKLGNNTIWSEQGDTEVTYRSMGTAYIYPNAEEASF